MSTIDTTIRQLFDKLEQRKAKVASLKAEVAKSWQTNGVIRQIGQTATTNIQTAPAELIEELATQVLVISGARAEASTKLNRIIDPKLQGYTVDQWFNDFAKRLATIGIREEEKQLEALETRLNSVLSPDERRRIEVELLLKEV